ncbi:hypothetical protein FIV42_29135 [Persicimonas caeni]|uniref:Uncharacterized protein n=1 Tax=Persicimonas caeni TaxID=2292766 RepID=A0A4Y6Q2I6_PERCE|nr:hypothetical protein [Persicimonas caeni]QDG54660.1 hypothetical protein FIV42_29135 [Persicimonas caeni]QED35881.1 hypothetical protein FRD00_29130 [Persicimonas caeni]
MKMQHVHKRTIRRLGSLVLGLTALLAVLSLHPVVSLAQTSDSDEKQQRFRERIVKSWKWKPRSGVGLTTEKYAREYLARYFDSQGEWKGDSAGIGSQHVLADTSLVLFQTSRLDIIVLPLSGVEHNWVVVVRRDTGEVVLNDNFTCGTYESHFEFVDVDGEAPLELLNVGSGSCASQFSAQSFRIYELTEWAKLLEQRGVADYGGQCPKIVNQLIEPYPRRQERDSKGHLSFEFRVSYGLVMKHDEGYCAPSKPHAVLKRTCEYIAEERRFKCSDDVVDAHTMTLPEIKTAGKWTDNADNIRWVLENSQVLRARGFRFPSGFLERLPRHLPKGSGD